MSEVTREQFEFIHDTKVRHTPTGATVSTLPYKNPEDTANTVIENPGRAGEVLPGGEEYSNDEILAIAITLLRERALEDGN